MKPTCNVCKKSFKNERGLRVHRAFKMHPAEGLTPTEKAYEKVEALSAPKLIAEVGIFETPPLSRFVHYVKWLSNFPPEEKVTILEAVVQYLEREPNAKRS